MKTCTKCQLSKDRSKYHKDKYARDGYYASCIDCNKHKRNDVIKKAAYDKEYRKTLGWKKAANQFKVSIRTLEVAMELQNGLCAICNKPEVNKHQSGVTMRLAIDHDHATGKFRGFLCQKCNQGLGMFLDNPLLLQKAIVYLNHASWMQEE